MRFDRLRILEAGAHSLRAIRSVMFSGDPGRFERPPTVRGVGRPDTASSFNLKHDQIGLRYEERVDALRIVPTRSDRPAGLRPKTWRPVQSSDPEILHHREAEPKTPRVHPRAVHTAANLQYIRELENVNKAEYR